jgi:Mor family transcriptional regulator
MVFASILKINTRRSKALKYIKAQSVLPEEVIKIIQQYVDGECVYIPRKDENTKAWGEKSGTKVSLMRRNEEIWKKYTFGTTITDLSCEYYLSEQSVRRIICEQRKMLR